MMKSRNLFFKAIVLSAITMAGLQLFDSCKKDDPETKISDVINVAPVENLKAGLQSATSLSNLPAAITTAATTITTIIDNNELTAFANADIAALIQFYQTNITLSSTEVTKLKDNDPYTYSDVINRMSKMPSLISAAEMSNHYDAMLQNTTFSSLLIKDPGTVKDLYAVNRYQGVLDLQKYITDYTIPMLQQINALKTDALKSASTATSAKEYTTEEKQKIATMLNLVLGNNNLINDVYQNALEAQHSGGTTN